MKTVRIVYFVVALLFCQLQFAQNTDEDDAKLSLDGGPISDQFEFIFQKSGNYRADGVRYEVVREANLYKLRQNILDSLKVASKNSIELQSVIAENEITIQALNKKLEETTQSLSQVSEEKDSMSFLGIPIAKGSYNAIMWTIIIGLLVLLALFVYKFRNSNVLTQEAKTALSEIEIEYEDHRRRALEREQKISRQLQDEINKHKKTK
ncbi:tRNA (guanine-N1)-methyltransferase [Arenibacter sp. GZD96]|uniref:hypothetical protein n=1 Tax=Aurantibrevibacter litoralis TaxID=3106030 RepID=UPI002AFEC3B1|nr:hypothetical protein [Arenibacter sp. GZD-96]MEA1786316.1 tRNA (guanine-N1)-methyltransferase [Arenibacter sp. GZD-96]